MPKIPSQLNVRDSLRKPMFKPIKCVACGGTGVSSSGKPCEPCSIKRGVEQLDRGEGIPFSKIYQKPVDIFDL